VCVCVCVCVSVHVPVGCIESVLVLEGGVTFSLPCCSD